MKNPFKEEKVEIDLDWLVEMLLSFVERLEVEVDEIRNDLEDLVQTLEEDFD